MEWGLIWILIGLAVIGAWLLVEDIPLPGISLLWIGGAAIGTGILLLGSDASFVMASVTFVALLGIGVAASLHTQRSRDLSVNVNRPEAGLTGRHATVVSTDAFSLRVRLGDSDWQARMPEDMPMPKVGTPVRVEAVDGTVLVVRPEPPPGA